MDITQPVVWVLATLTLLSGAFVVLAVVLHAWEKIMRKRISFFDYISTHALLLMFIVACTATLGSLFLSEYAGWTPCRLCWFQRIFMYPQVIVLGIALLKKNTSVASTVLILSIIGALIAGYHYSEQVLAALTPKDLLAPCDNSGTSCASTPFFRFGYITIPMMALTAFLLNIVGTFSIFRTQKLARVLVNSL